MSLRTVATAFALVGGLSWVVRAFVEREVLTWAGLVMLGVACAATGAALVNSSVLPLRLFVAVAFPLLAWSVHEVTRDAAADATVDAVYGVVAVVAALVAWWRHPHSQGRHAPRHGRTKHAA